MTIQQDAGDESDEHDHDDTQLTLLDEQINGTGGLLEDAHPQTVPVIRQSGEFAIADKTIPQQMPQITQKEKNTRLFGDIKITKNSVIYLKLINFILTPFF